MDVLLRGYEVNKETWFYLSTLLIIAVFFRFNRFWSLRNLDLVLLLLPAPGLLLVNILPSRSGRTFGSSPFPVCFWHDYWPTQSCSGGLNWGKT